MRDKRPFSDAEKRKFKRIEKFFVVVTKLADDTSPDWTIVNLENISEGGILFNHTEPFAKGTRLSIQIKVLPNRPPVQCVGTVVRAQKLGELNLYESAVQFTEVNPDGRTLIHEALGA